MDGSILYLPLSRFPSLLAALIAFFSFGVSAFAQPRPEGSLSESNYTSPSGRLNCAMEGVPIGSPGFFIDDSSTPEFEGVTFGYDEGDSFMVWVVRLQKDGRKDESPATSDEFPVTAETYIPYFYSELPYEISELSQGDMGEIGGRSGLLMLLAGLSPFGSYSFDPLSVGEAVLAFLVNALIFFCTVWIAQGIPTSKSTCRR